MEKINDSYNQMHDVKPSWSKATEAVAFRNDCDAYSRVLAIMKKEINDSADCRNMIRPYTDFMALCTRVGARIPAESLKYNDTQVKPAAYILISDPAKGKSTMVSDVNNAYKAGLNGIPGKSFANHDMRGIYYDSYNNEDFMVYSDLGQNRIKPGTRQENFLAGIVLLLDTPTTLFDAANPDLKMSDKMISKVKLFSATANYLWYEGYEEQVNAVAINRRFDVVGVVGNPGDFNSKVGTNLSRLYGELHEVENNLEGFNTELAKFDKKNIFCVAKPIDPGSTSAHRVKRITEAFSEVAYDDDMMEHLEVKFARNTHKVLRNAIGNVAWFWSMMGYKLMQELKDKQFTEKSQFLLALSDLTEKASKVQDFQKLMPCLIALQTNLFDSSYIYRSCPENLNQHANVAPRCMYESYRMTISNSGEGAQQIGYASNMDSIHTMSFQYGPDIIKIGALPNADKQFIISLMRCLFNRRIQALDSTMQAMTTPQMLYKSDKAIRCVNILSSLAYHMLFSTHTLFLNHIDLSEVLQNSTVINMKQYLEWEKDVESKSGHVHTCEILDSYKKAVSERVTNLNGIQSIDVHSINPVCYPTKLPFYGRCNALVNTTSKQYERNVKFGARSGWYDDVVHAFGSVYGGLLKMIGPSVSVPQYSFTDENIRFLNAMKSIHKHRNNTNLSEAIKEHVAKAGYNTRMYKYDNKAAVSSFTKVNRPAGESQGGTKKRKKKSSPQAKAARARLAAFKKETEEFIKEHGLDNLSDSSEEEYDIPTMICEAMLSIQSATNPDEMDDALRSKVNELARVVGDARKLPTTADEINKIAKRCEHRFNQMQGDDEVENPDDPEDLEVTPVIKTVLLKFIKEARLKILSDTKKSTNLTDMTFAEAVEAEREKIRKADQTRAESEDEPVDKAQETLNKARDNESISSDDDYNSTTGTPLWEATNQALTHFGKTTKEREEFYHVHQDSIKTSSWLPFSRKPQELKFEPTSWYTFMTAMPRSKSSKKLKWHVDTLGMKLPKELEPFLDVPLKKLAEIWMKTRNEHMNHEKWQEKIDALGLSMDITRAKEATHYLNSYSTEQIMVDREKVLALITKDVRTCKDGTKTTSRLDYYLSIIKAWPVVDKIVSMKDWFMEKGKQAFYFGKSKICMPECVRNNSTYKKWKEWWASTIWCRITRVGEWIQEKYEAVAKFLDEHKWKIMAASTVAGIALVAKLYSNGKESLEHDDEFQDRKKLVHEVMKPAGEPEGAFTVSSSYSLITSAENIDYEHLQEFQNNKDRINAMPFRNSVISYFIKNRFWGDLWYTSVGNSYQPKNQEALQNIWRESFMYSVLMQVDATYFKAHLPEPGVYKEKLITKDKFLSAHNMPYSLKQVNCLTTDGRCKLGKKMKCVKCYFIESLISQDMEDRLAVDLCNAKFLGFFHPTSKPDVNSEAVYLQEIIQNATQLRTIMAKCSEVSNCTPEEIQEKSVAIGKFLKWWFASTVYLRVNTLASPNPVTITGNIVGQTVCVDHHILPKFEDKALIELLTPHVPAGVNLGGGIVTAGRKGNKGDVVKVEWSSLKVTSTPQVMQYYTQDVAFIAGWPRAFPEIQVPEDLFRSDDYHKQFQYKKNTGMFLDAVGIWKEYFLAGKDIHDNTYKEMFTDACFLKPSRTFQKQEYTFTFRPRDAYGECITLPGRATPEEEKKAMGSYMSSSFDNCPVSLDYCESNYTGHYYFPYEAYASHAGRLGGCGGLLVNVDGGSTSILGMLCASLNSEFGAPPAYLFQRLSLELVNAKIVSLGKYTSSEKGSYFVPDESKMMIGYDNSCNDSPSDRVTIIAKGKSFVNKKTYLTAGKMVESPLYEHLGPPEGYAPAHNDIMPDGKRPSDRNFEKLMKVPNGSVQEKYARVNAIYKAVKWGGNKFERVPDEEKIKVLGTDEAISRLTFTNAVDATWPQFVKYYMKHFELTEWEPCNRPDLFAYYNFDTIKVFETTKTGLACMWHDGKLIKAYPRFYNFFKRNVQAMYQDMVDGKIPRFYARDCLKAELLPEEKVGNKIRTFKILSPFLEVLSKKITGDLIRFTQTKMPETFATPHEVSETFEGFTGPFTGYNPYHVNFAKLMLYIGGFYDTVIDETGITKEAGMEDRCLAIDFSNYDFSVILEWVTREIFTIPERYWHNFPLHKKLIEAYYTALRGIRILTCYKDEVLLINTSGINFSGCGETYHNNCFCNSFKVVCSLAETYDSAFDYKLSEKQIADFLLCNFHHMEGGDDLIIQISAGFKKIFNFDVYKNFYRKAGFDITPASKKGELDFCNYYTDGDFLQYRVTVEDDFPFVVKKTSPLLKTGRYVQQDAPCLDEKVAASLGSTVEQQCAIYFYGIFQYLLQECGRRSREEYDEVLAKTFEPAVRLVLERNEGFSGFPSYEEYKQQGYLVKPLPGLVNQGKFEFASIDNGVGSLLNVL